MLLYIILIIVSLLIIPICSWLFGGSFLKILQNEMYLTVMVIIFGIIWGIIFNESFDKNFNSK